MINLVLLALQVNNDASPPTQSNEAKLQDTSKMPWFRRRQIPVAPDFSFVQQPQNGCRPDAVFCIFYSSLGDLGTSSMKLHNSITSNDVYLYSVYRCFEESEGYEVYYCVR